MSERPLRLGDMVDDYCIRCRLLLNHDVASLFESQVAKVTCRTCFTTHDYRRGEVPAKRSAKQKETEKLMEQVLASMAPPPPTAPLPEAPLPRKRRDLWAEVERLKKK